MMARRTGTSGAVPMAGPTASTALAVPQPAFYVMPCAAIAIQHIGAILRETRPVAPKSCTHPHRTKIPP